MMKKFSSVTNAFESILKRIDSWESLPEQDEDAHCPVNNPLCDGYGNIIENGRARPCACVQRDVKKSQWQDARIPKRFLSADLESFSTLTPSLRKHLATARDYVQNYSLDEPTGLYIFGSTGIGKTHLAIGILKGLIARGFDGVFYNVVDLLDAIRSTFDPELPTAPRGRLIEDLNRQILLLDDFGQQKTSTWVADRLYAFINRRYQDCKTLIITSNIKYQDLPLKVDASIASRIMDICIEMDEMKGDDHRLVDKQIKKPKPRFRQRYSQPL